MAVYVEDDPTGKSEKIEGNLVGWSDGWASLRKDSLTIHVPVTQIRGVHDWGR